ncbi:MAG: DUF3786 domain-containing protein [Oscillospiraceae bacterium]|jgi:hypothetical protein|nr:DUF3786 domain-containing protein [Oscillospiraceae bacterium]
MSGQEHARRGAAPAVRSIVNNKEERPLAHYAALFARLQPDDAVARCKIGFDNGSFELTYMGAAHKINFPDFAVEPELSNAEKILLLRYLTEGCLRLPAGRFITFREAPKAAIYDANFQGRCLKRLAYGFGAQLPLWRKVMRSLGALELPEYGDAAFDWEIMPALTVRFILWEGDEEDGFPPSAQILFSDNFPQAFSAEDLAVVGDVTINRMKAVKI